MAAWVWLAALFCGSQAAVLPPPWADVKRNPCASHPRGWLMLYWPTDGKCYTIYKEKGHTAEAETNGTVNRFRFEFKGYVSQHNSVEAFNSYTVRHNFLKFLVGSESKSMKGHPCPETQELSPGRWGGRTIAECKCPPGTAQLPLSTTCHKLFERGPCRPGEYFAPVEESFNKKGERQGMCVRPQHCADETLLHWPADGRCYYRLSQGPCYQGSILDVGSDGVANCTCAPDGPHYWSPDSGCYAHYTRGPCERGQLFLPGARCGCEDHLPHYHNDTGMCYEIDSIGPCPKGHIFSITKVTPQGSKAECTCKAFHARASDGACYRLYTKGPCANDEMIARGGRCTKVPCARGRLYVPERRRCYRPGTPEPCPAGEVVAFDFEARPALDGLSHNGVCACGGGACARREVAACQTRKGAAVYGGACHTLHTQGPCPANSWLVRDGHVTCRCRPGHLPPDCRPDTRLAIKS